MMMKSKPVCCVLSLHIFSTGRTQDHVIKTSYQKNVSEGSLSLVNIPMICSDSEELPEDIMYIH